MSPHEIFMSLEMGLIYGTIALGVYLTFRVINFSDLTCDGSFVLGAAVCAKSLEAHVNPWLALLAAMLAGSLAGTATAFLNLRLKINPLLSGILVGFMLYSLNLRIMGGMPNLNLSFFESIFSKNPLWQLFGISLGLCTMITYLLMTDFGLALRSLGHNPKLAQLYGIDVAFLKTFALALSNATVALGGALFAQHQGFADIGSGIGSVIIALASLMIGEKIFPFSSMLWKSAACFIGSIAYRFFISFALHSDQFGLCTSDLNMITGLLIIVTLYFSRKNSC